MDNTENMTGILLDSMASEQLPFWYLVTSNVINGLTILIMIPHMLIIFTMRTRRHSAARNNNTLLRHLSVNVIIQSTLRLGVESVSTQQVIRDRLWLCTLMSVLWQYFMLCKLAVVLATGVDRFIAIVWASRYSSRIFSNHINKFYLTLYILWSMVFIWLTVRYKAHPLSHANMTLCLLIITATPFTAVCIFCGVAIPTLTVCVLFSYILITTHQVSNRLPRRIIRAIHSYKILFVLVAAMTISWIPSLLHSILLTLDGHVRLYLLIISQLSIAINNCLHAVMYLSLDGTYRRNCLVTICRKKEKQSDSTRLDDLLRQRLERSASIHPPSPGGGQQQSPSISVTSP